MPSHPSYYTDGKHLYEIAEQKTVTNYGLLGGTITDTVLRECESEAEAHVDELYMMALTPVANAGLSPSSQVHQ